MRFLVHMRKNRTIPALETLLLQAHVNWFFILGEKWIGNSSEELEMKQSLTMVCIDYLGHDVPFWNRTSTGRERLIRSHSSARFCFELSGNSN